MNFYQRLLVRPPGSSIYAAVSDPLTVVRDLLVRLRAFSEEHQSRTVLMLFLLDLALRLGCIGLYCGGFLAGDTGLYVGIARSLVEGEGFSYEGRPTAFVMPLYPLFLAILPRPRFDLENRR